MTKITIISGFTAIPQGRVDLGEMRLDETTVRDIKVKISQEPNMIPVEKQVLFWRGYKLDQDDQTLLEACVGVCPGESLQTKGGCKSNNTHNSDNDNNSSSNDNSSSGSSSSISSNQEADEKEENSLVLFLTVPLERRTSNNMDESASSFPPILARSFSDLITTVRQELTTQGASSSSIKRDRDGQGGSWLWAGAGAGAGAGGVNQGCSIV